MNLPEATAGEEVGSEQQRAPGLGVTWSWRETEEDSPQDGPPCARQAVLMSRARPTCMYGCVCIRVPVAGLVEEPGKDQLGVPVPQAQPCSLLGKLAWRVPSSFLSNTSVNVDA